MKQAMIIMNPSSGKEEARQHLQHLENVLHEQQYKVIVNETAKELDATHFCAAACRDRYDLVVSIGGDGTLHETINGMHHQEHRPLLGIIPLGTVNDFARALHIPLDPGEAVRNIASTHTKSVDIGQLNDQLFANVVAAGSLAETLSNVSSDDKSKFGALAYIKDGMKELTSKSIHTMHITYDGKTWEGQSPLFIAALTNSVGGFEKLAPQAAVDDGLLHCFIIKDLNLVHTLTAGFSLLLGKLKNHKEVIYFTARDVKVTSSEKVATNVDGEEGTSLPIHLQVLPSHIKIIVPE
ncbi:YegS/Rv2252/BmrU family lipid kinase [Paenibacillus shirakamiensis]|uniref:YegS/Rv2252/BmrU family lipid kinase n=1 Tax=Paenibacillus shirakamiensis TaxID=1265935 RepID=A0ABS4JEZ3_9BACL|nr:YegS/Rv2252/BmrU family lipid kinase [Paenibacillus shirakamiensis]MBP2000280.1 YegS/Rv2252/BmrU family lipid kinase [Paenibacillus shirakamiensis]